MKKVLDFGTYKKGKTMIKVENVEVWGFEHAVRGMRNPMNSWGKSDSYPSLMTADNEFYLGENDLDLMQRLYKAGTEHRKYLRQIMVSMDITAPLYWWKEFDTYKIGTVANSCSTMHKIHAKEFELDDFSHEHLDEGGLICINCTIENLNYYRDRYLESHSKADWWNMIQLLPTSYNQKRTVTLNYEVAVSIIKQRSHHKLDEWHYLCDRLHELPYLHKIMGVE